MAENDTHPGHRARVEWANWNFGEPNDWLGVEGCAAIAGTGRWSDLRCDEDVGPALPK